MSEADLSIIDTSLWKPVQSPGLRAPRNQVPYDSPEVQSVLTEAFGVMFPNIIEEKRGFKRYTAINVQNKDVMQLAKPVKNINDIPKAEMMRLMEGWIRLRRKLQEGEISKGVSAILLNFRVPNPRQCLDRYMLYKEGDEQRLVIRWGYETKDEPAVSLERAISILMDVPLGHMRSILSTSMSPTTSTVPVGQMLASAAAGEGGRKVNGSFSKVGNNKVIFGIVAVCVVMLSLGIYGISKAVTTKEQQVTVTQIESLKAEEELAFITEVEQWEEEETLAEPVVQPEPIVVERVKVVEVVKEVPVAKVEAPAPSLEGALISAPAKPKTVDLSEMLGGADTAKSSAPKNKKSLSIDGMLEGEQAKSGADLLGDMLN